jgi:hypothetical protein
LRTDPKTSGRDQQPDAPDGDPGPPAAIKRGLAHLGEILIASVGAPPKGPVGRDKGPVRHFRGGDLGNNFYFMWSLERVGVTFGLKTIGDVDWYACGAEALVRNQLWTDVRELPKGHWGNGEVDTSFALLFLNRANFMEDLTTTLKGRVHDPGGHEFRSADPRDLEKLFGKSADPRTKPADPPPADTASPDQRQKDELSKPSAPPVTDAEAFNAEADRLAKALVVATAAQRATLLTKMRESKGAVYTEALLRAIPKLESDALKETRDTLATRLTRMRADTLREMLKDEDRELRRAAALACAMKEDRKHIPDLIAVLADKEALVTRAARAALKSLTQQDFGPETDVAADKARAVADWRAWWEKEKGSN